MGTRVEGVDDGDDGDDGDFWWQWMVMSEASGGCVDGCVLHGFTCCMRAADGCVCHRC